MFAYENTKNNPTIDVLINIADKCNVSLDCLPEEVIILSNFKLREILYYLYIKWQ